MKTLTVIIFFITFSAFVVIPTLGVIVDCIDHIISKIRGGKTPRKTSIPPPDYHDW